MKLLGRHIDYKTRQGEAGIVPEELEDMWHLYNLLTTGDRLRCSTVRKVVQESATGSTSSNRVRVTLTIEIESIDYDPQVCELHVKGRNVQQNDHVKMGAYHTLDLELNRKVNLWKGNWDSIALDRLEMACNPAANADFAAIVMQEGLANLFLLTPNMMIDKSKIDVNIPRKRRGHNAAHEKALTKFYDLVYQAILKHVNFKQMKCILVASPGFTKDEFMKYLYQEIAKDSSKTEAKELLDNKSKFLLAHSSSGFKHALHEVLADPAVAARLSDTRALGDSKLLDDFHQQLTHDPDRVCYGLKSTEAAIAQQAIEKLLITDTLFRSYDFATRTRYVRMVDSVREAGGEVRVFSSLHISGEHLDKLGGLAASLRFPMPELELSDSD